MIENLRPRIDALELPMLKQAKISASVLRLDVIDALVSGNKWFKLKTYLADAKEKGNDAIITFGGAFSNHILATAAACKKTGFLSAGIIRGEKPATISPTLTHAAALGMQLFFVSRESYQTKKIPPAALANYSQPYVVTEGGYGIQGMLGAKDILGIPLSHQYTHILAVVGTGTTLAGLVEAAQSNQQVIGFSVLKNNLALAAEINHLLSAKNKNRFELLHQFHFGGYAKHTNELIGFMNDWYTQTRIPSDFVYTGKLFYAFQHLCQQRYFPLGAKVLLIHSGGLQGNSSLKPGTLIF